MAKRNPLIDELKADDVQAGLCEGGGKGQADVAQPDDADRIDGGLVGGASLKAADFADLIKNAVC